MKDIRRYHWDLYKDHNQNEVKKFEADHNKFVLFDFYSSKKRSIKGDIPKGIDKDTQGVYLLICKVKENSNEPNGVRVGQGNVWERLPIHRNDEQRKFNKVVIIFHLDKRYLTTKRMEYLENLFIDYFRKNPQLWICNNKNKNRINSSLSELDKKQISQDFDFLKYGLKIFEYPIYKISDQKSIPDHSSSKNSPIKNDEKTHRCIVLIQREKILAYAHLVHNRGGDKDLVWFEEEWQFKMRPKEKDREEFIKFLATKNVKDQIYPNYYTNGDIKIKILKNSKMPTSTAARLLLGGKSQRGPECWINLKTRKSLNGHKISNKKARALREYKRKNKLCKLN